MDKVTSSLYIIAISLGKKNNEEIMSPGSTGVGSPGGPSKRTRLSTRKKVVEALGGPRFSTADIIQNTMEVGKEVVKMFKDL